MKFKSILSIAVFSIAFVFSTFLAGLFVDKSDYQSNLVPPVSEYELPDYSQSDSSELQKTIWLFLNEDRENGLAMARELRSQTASTIVNEQRATVNLAMKMNRMNYSRLPSDFQTAWDNHRGAWNEQASFLRHAVKDGNIENIDNDSISEYETNSREINRTYLILLRTAQKYGVYFRQ